MPPRLSSFAPPIVSYNRTTPPPDRQRDIAPGRPAPTTSRPVTPGDRHVVVRQAGPADVPPVLRWLLEDMRHANVVVRDSHSVTGARREIKRILNHRMQKCLYLDNMQAQKDFEREVRVDEHGTIVIEDGPFTKLLHTGGTMLINAARFSPQQLEAFNTLMEDQVWEGVRAERRVRIIFLCDVDTLQDNRLSGAQISRTAFRDLSQHAFPACDDPPVPPARSGHPADATIIDLEGDPLWRRKVFGGPEIRGRKWIQKPALLNDNFRNTVVIRNAPDDPYLNDQVHEWRRAGKDVRVEAGVPPEEFEERLASKRRAARDDLHQLWRRDAPVCIVNALNIDDTLHSFIGVRGNDPVRIQSLLRSAKAQLSKEDVPLVLVGSNLPEPMWDKLMLHRDGFCAAAAPGVRVPVKYRQYVTPLKQDIRPTWSAQRPVSFSFCHDDALAHIPADASTTHLFVTPTMRADELVASLKRLDGQHRGGAALPPLKVEMRQLAMDLMDGKTVVLHGLENNPELTSDLATLLHPPHYMIINGERYHFGDAGGLTGKLVVVTSDPALCRRHGLSPVHERRFEGEGHKEQWKQAIRNALLANFGETYHDEIKELLPKIFVLFDAMRRQGLSPKNAPIVSYRQVETLVQHLCAHVAPPEDPDQRYQRVLRSFFKDMLIGDYRRTELRQDERYEQLKFLVRALFPKQMKSVPDGQVDIRRLARLLRRADHLQDICANAWRFLNCFGLAVVQDIVDDVVPGVGAAPRAGGGVDVEERVLALVLEQAQRHRLPLSPLLVKEAGRRTGRSAMSAARKVEAYRRPPRLERDWKNSAKAGLAQSRGNALFFKGPPGSGKTHMANLLTDLVGSARHVASIADIGTPPYADVLEAWADDVPENKPALLVDEANLARDGSHDMLRAMTADGTVLVNGRRRELSENHRVIFTGNADSFPGRSPQGVAETFAKLQFKTMDEDTLRARFVTPLLDHALSLPNMRRAALSRAYVEQHAARIHATLQQAYPDKNLSPRNLEEYLAQIVCRLRSRKQKKSGAALAPWMARLALNVYGGALPAEDGEAFEAWLRHYFGLAPQARLPDMPAVSSGALKAAGLARTNATRELADSVAWWLKSQQLRDGFSHKKEKTLGQKALLIEGPASRGKDVVVEAVLKEKGLDYVRINANPNNLQHLRNTLADARENGRIVVISELNLLPSDILEGELNALLTGDTPAAPGFGIIATVNPSGYAGRKPLSPALENRMLKKVIGDYPTRELRAIARVLAGKARRPVVSRYIRVPYLWSARKTVRNLVQRHQQLSNALAAYPSEHKPKIRELRETINVLSNRQTMQLDEAFRSTYAYYLRLADASGGAALNVMRAGEADSGADIKKQLERLLSLARPESLSHPQLAADPSLLIASPIAYDAQAHRLRYSPFATPSRLYEALLALLAEGLKPDAQDADARLQPPDWSAGQPAVQPEPVSMAPVGNKSGVGRASPPGTIGTVSNDSLEGTWLVCARVRLDGRIIPANAARFVDPEPNSELVGGKEIELVDIACQSNAGGGYRVYLPVPHLTRPARVSLGGTPAQAVLRDERGGWYVLANRPVVSRVAYRLVVHEEPPGPVGQGRLFQGLNMKSRSDGGMNAIEAIRTLAAETKREGLGREITVGRLKELFANPRYFRASHQDAEALGRLHDMASRCQHFLEHGQGVCHEFANTFAAVLEQVFRIPARLCDGHHSKSGAIPRIAHRWVEYCGSDGRWHVVDPTPPQMAPDADTTSGPESDSGSDAGFQDIYGIGAFTISRNVLKHFSPAKLGLEYWDIQNDGNRYKPVGNRLVIERLIRGETDIYLDQSASTSARLREVLLKEVPALANVEDWRRFLVKMTRPFQALIERGVPLSFYNRDAKWERMTSSNALQRGACPDSDDDKIRRVDDTRLVIDRHSAAFLDRLASHYYEAVLAARGIDPQDRDAVLGCLFDELETVFRRDEGGPLRITIHGTDMEIRFNDLLNHQVRRVMNERKTQGERLDGLFEVLARRDVSAITPETDPVLNMIDSLHTREFLSQFDGNARLQMLSTIFRRMSRTLPANAPDSFKAWYLRHALSVVRDLQGENGLQSGLLTKAISEAVDFLEKGVMNIADPVQQNLLLEIFRQLPKNAINDRQAREDIVRRFNNLPQPPFSDAGFAALIREFRRVAVGARATA